MRRVLGAALTLLVTGGLALIGYGWFTQGDWPTGEQVEAIICAVRGG